VLEQATYHLWHGIDPMAEFCRNADPDAFLVGGEGSYVIDRAGRRYLDARSAMWNVSLGYSCEPVKEAMRRQLDAMPGGTILRFEHPPEISVRYAAALAATLPEPLNYVRFGNTGSQMTEAAAMLSRFYRRMTGEPWRNQVIALRGSYHGSGPLASALSGEPVLHNYSAPLDVHTRYISRPLPGSCGVEDGARCDGSCVGPFLEALDLVGEELVTAVILEPVLGSYVLSLSGHYLHRIAQECRARGIHVIADEVTTGAGRTGAMTAVERFGLVPDMVLLAKGISAGYFPLAALVVGSPIYDALAAEELWLGFPNGSTTDGHPVGMAAGLAVLDILGAEGFYARVRETGEFLRSVLVESLADIPAAGEILGAGLMLGVECVDDSGERWPASQVDKLRLACRDNGMLTSYAYGVLPLLPPLILSRDECADLAGRLARSFRAVRKDG
jgi:adenosylmethionine-8-amino-7-oxononanoate aminotransferase